VGALFGKFCGAYSQDQNERPNDRVLFNFCRTISTSIFVYGIVHTLTTSYFFLRCFPYFLIGNFDLIINVKQLNSLKQCSTATRPTSHN